MTVPNIGDTFRTHQHKNVAWDTPTLDMFASRLNSQIDIYVSWKFDWEAASVWHGEAKPCCILPFCLVSGMQSKLLHHERAENIIENLILAPVWTRQLRFDKLTFRLILFRATQERRAG